jgi:hypothetical protein
MIESPAVLWHRQYDRLTPREWSSYVLLWFEWQAARAAGDFAAADYLRAQFSGWDKYLHDPYVNGRYKFHAVFETVAHRHARITERLGMESCACRARTS